MVSKNLYVCPSVTNFDPNYKSELCNAVVSIASYYSISGWVNLIILCKKQYYSMYMDGWVMGA